MKIHNIDLDVVELGTGKADGSIRYSMEISGLNNVDKIMSAFLAGKSGLNSYKDKKLDLINAILLVNTLISLLKKGK